MDTDEAHHAKQQIDEVYNEARTIMDEYMEKMRRVLKMYGEFGLW